MQIIPILLILSHSYSIEGNVAIIPSHKSNYFTLLNAREGVQRCSAIYKNGREKVRQQTLRGTEIKPSRRSQSTTNIWHEIISLPGPGFLSFFLFCIQSTGTEPDTRVHVSPQTRRIAKTCEHAGAWTKKRTKCAFPQVRFASTT